MKPTNQTINIPSVIQFLKMIDTFYASVVSYACLHLILMNAIDGKCDSFSHFFEGRVWFCNYTILYTGFVTTLLFKTVWGTIFLCFWKKSLLLINLSAHLFDQKYSQTSNLVKYYYIIISAVKQLIVINRI